MESEACKGDVIEVGLEKHTGLDIKGQGTGRWGDRGDGVESPLTLILYCSVPFRLGLPRECQRELLPNSLTLQMWK